ncbi:conserved hypothetical protein [Vibrio crassostreae]|uniref:hypothetical protein n=1 Tax=Vibrio crassostreae TaxID=246167 RepID=UPI0005E5C5E4|nr:hypothetical protein [Vibrio crassostreae]MDH5951285.1 hypothetical protein [Vibrio crassostreae]TCU03000.1 hypothetical protein EDB32_12865 [Vibrio crassostreae]CAK1768223.1 conserved hypothetical protein [Vibrio crassostreae]CAK1771935.1 conserved hypothetical protein [Vibrio crassostreae]CAK1790702.1 conserved hypothetical protein [Vibrio crassostreae]
MSQHNDIQLRRRIERILERHPNASSLAVRQRLIVDVKPAHFYLHLIPFYDQDRIDDSSDIQRELDRMMAMHLGLSVIARTLLTKPYNYRQIERALLKLTLNFNHTEQTRLCKIVHFGHDMAKDEHHKSKMVMHLQKLGHRLPDIFLILRQSTRVEIIDR